MRQCAVVVEGQSEAVFVDRVLNPLAWSREAYLTPIIVPTSSTPTRTHKARVEVQVGNTIATSSFVYAISRNGTASV